MYNAILKVTAQCFANAHILRAMRIYFRVYYQVKDLIHHYPLAHFITII